MKNIYLSHNDNGKGRYDSHTVSINQPDEFFFIPEADISSYNLFDINGYGETKEEALKDLFNKLNYLFNEYKVLEKINNVFHLEKEEQATKKQEKRKFIKPFSKKGYSDTGILAFLRGISQPRRFSFCG